MQSPAASFREAGTGTSVVCVHASASSSGQWRPLMEKLASRYRTVAVDLYGYAQSPAWPDDQDLWLADEARLIEPVLRKAGDRFHLVGHSYGGALALRIALENQERLRSLVLYEPVLFAALLAEDPEQPAAREITSVRNDTTDAVDRGDLESSGARFVDYWMGAGAWADMPEKRRPALASSMRKVKAEWHAVFHEPTPVAAFARLELPILFLKGTESPASTRNIARLLLAQMPRATVVELPGVGHMGPVTHPEQVNAEIAAFLDRVG
ncbi:MAG TPA: alpha/beta hydrolase [Kofleriaceae bacterium]|nr:alpha/beta hydrolase [Kofleriaceae bacterium]